MFDILYFWESMVTNNPQKTGLRYTIALWYFDSLHIDFG